MSPLSGGGGVSEARYEPYSNAENIHYHVLKGDSAFAAKINGTPSGTSVPYDTVVGVENSIVTQSSSEIGKIVLYNTTKTEEALISSVNTTTHVITVTDAADIVGWADNDNIQANSITVVDPAGPPYFFDLDMSGVLAAACDLIGIHLAIADTGLNAGVWTHPYEAYALSKYYGITNSVVSRWAVMGTLLVPIISQRFSIEWEASGAASHYCVARIMGKRE